jgi:hypothetical protein
MTLQVEGGGFRFKTKSVGGYWSWEVDSQNQQGVGQFYTVQDIQTPYGPLTNVMIPIPGNVIAEMASSLAQFQQQLSPLLTLVQPAQTTFTVTITEGDPDVSVGTVKVQNSGAFGSFMSAFATPSVPWLKTSPSSVDGLGKNEQASFGIVLSPQILLSSGSPYSGVVLLQDNRNPQTTIPIIVNVVVLPRPVIVASPTLTTLTYVLCTNTPGPSQQLTVQNGGPIGSTLDFTIAKVNNASAWLSFSPSGGTGIPSSGMFPVTLSIVQAGVPMVPGVYKEVLRISSPNAANGHVDVNVELSVSP